MSVQLHGSFPEAGTLQISKHDTLVLEALQHCAVRLSVEHLCRNQCGAA